MLITFVIGRCFAFLFRLRLWKTYWLFVKSVWNIFIPLLISLIFLIKRSFYSKNSYFQAIFALLMLIKVENCSLILLNKCWKCGKLLPENTQNCLSDRFFPPFDFLYRLYEAYYINVKTVLTTPLFCAAVFVRNVNIIIIVWSICT